jgi:hypothetical protein
MARRIEIREWEMSDKSELDLDAERAAFENATQGLLLPTRFECWLAARRATIQPTAAEPVHQGRIHTANGNWSDITEDEVGMWKADGFTVRTLYTAPVAAADAVRDARLRFVFQEFLTSLPARRDWLNPDAEREMRALFNELNATPKEPAK